MSDYIYPIIGPVQKNVSKPVTKPKKAKKNRKVGSPPFGGHATLTESLLSYWKLDEESGARADSVGGRNLSVTGTNGFASGKIGNAWNSTVNGVGHLTHAHVDEFDFGSGDWSISLWVYGLAAEVDKGLISQASGFSTGGWFIFTSGSTIRVRINSTNFQSSTSYLANNWYHIVFRVRESTPRKQIWVNGSSTLTSTNAVVPSTVTTSFSIGTLFNGTTNRHKGYIDEVGIWNKELTDAEIAALYASGSGLTY